MGIYAADPLCICFCTFRFRIRCRHGLRHDGDLLSLKHAGPEQHPFHLAEIGGRLA